ncbi:hypothetical protein [Palleronia caenipelagi]|uniref:Uncharacterized protein n=1 Tax=Palleronia caenipelagi TaxID=2489174 RepID=A0A547QB55_9RHOB|nr:hypothetical protein [Palleronia caenipelagi]TRD23614.1 hypothetical protein FEV53_00935 [Palleronia caenipelagi]
MLIQMDGLPAETLAILRAPVGLPAGMAFQPVSMEAVLGQEDSYRVIASVALTEHAVTADVAEWIWAQIEDAAPLVVKIGATRARIGEAAALAWVLDRERDG